MDHPLYNILKLINTLCMNHITFSLGGTVQKLTYPAGSGPTCTGKKGKSTVSAKNRQPGELKNRNERQVTR